MTQELVINQEIRGAVLAEETAKGFLAEVSGFGIVSAEDMAIAAELRESIRRAEKDAETEREQRKRPYLEEGRRIDQAFAPAKQLFAQALRALDRAIHDYRNREEAKRHAEEMARRQEAEKERLRLAKLAQKAEAKGLTETADRLAQEAEMVPEPVVESRAVKPDGFVTRKVWKFAITDENAIPRKFLMVDESAIRKVVTALGAEHGIPGIRAWCEESYASRSAK